jgi:CRP/FNR family cyclic AMP-dependent transcriptional regulator
MATAANVFIIGGPAGFLLSDGAGRSTLDYRRSVRVYAQGDRSNAIFVVLRGTVLLSVVSNGGKEAVVGVIGTGEFFGEDCILESEIRGSSAVTLERSRLLRVENQDLRYVLHRSSEFCENFMQQLLRRKGIMEEALADQLFSSSEQRLARVLIVLARPVNGAPMSAIPRMSQTTLAAMVGTTRSRINYFLGKFRGMSLVDGSQTLRVNVPGMKNMLANKRY